MFDGFDHPDFPELTAFAPDALQPSATTEAANAAPVWDAGGGVGGVGIAMLPQPGGGGGGGGGGELSGGGSGGGGGGGSGGGGAQMTLHERMEDAVGHELSKGKGPDDWRRERGVRGRPRRTAPRAAEWYNTFMIAVDKCDQQVADAAVLLDPGHCGSQWLRHPPARVEGGEPGHPRRCRGVTASTGKWR
jgi:hypothetical protein